MTPAQRAAININAKWLLLKNDDAAVKAFAGIIEDAYAEHNAAVAELVRCAQMLIAASPSDDVCRVITEAALARLEVERT